MGRKLSEVYKKAAVEFARRVTSALGDQVDSIVLYGSVARGEANRDSDIDILLISPQPMATRERISEICSDFTFERNYTFFISLVHFSREEFHWHTRVRSPFISNVFEDGMILYDNGAFSRVRGEAIAAS